MQTMPIISSKALQSRTAGVVCSFHGVRNFSAASWQAQRFCHACGKATPRKLAPYHQGTSDAVARVFAPKEIKRPQNCDNPFLPGDRQWPCTHLNRRTSPALVQALPISPFQHIAPSTATATGVALSVVPPWQATPASAATHPRVRRNQNRTPRGARSRRPRRERAGFYR